MTQPSAETPTPANRALEAEAATTDPATPAETAPPFLKPLLAKMRRNWIEVAAFASVMIVALIVRLYKLGTIPNVVTADVADNLQTAYHVIEGTGPGIFGFDWKPAPIFSMYHLAWTIRIFGDSVAAFRLFPVITSLLTIAGFYLLARRVMSTFAACTAATLLATNLIYLHFSRTAWENGNSALFAIGACYAIQRALDERDDGEWKKWWAITGVFVALGLYGYFTGRFIFVAVALIVALAVAAGDIDWKTATKGLGIAAAVSAVLFLPMAVNILQDWDLFTRRTDVVSIFNVPEDRPYEGESDAWAIAKINLDRNYHGLILQDGSEMNRGLWARYNPAGRAPLGFSAKHLFWGGLVTSLVLWRKSYAWWTFFVPLFIAEVFSLGTPDIARSMLFLPFYFLFIGLFIHELRNLIASPRTRIAVSGALLVLVALISITNVNDYFDWQREPGVQGSRLPGVAACEFELWSGLARDAAAAGPGLIDNAAFDQQRRELACSPLVNEWLPPLPEEEAG